MAWEFETDPAFQKELDWIADFVKHEIEPLEYVIKHPNDMKDPLRNKLIFDVAPLSHAFETYPASDRLYSLMNQELIHVVQGDLANEDDRRWRRFFQGKVHAQPEHPETLLYSYLTVPRFVAPRWYIEGSALVPSTAPAGSSLRALGLRGREPGPALTGLTALRGGLHRAAVPCFSRSAVCSGCPPSGDPGVSPAAGGPARPRWP